MPARARRCAWPSGNDRARVRKSAHRERKRKQKYWSLMASGSPDELRCKLMTDRELGAVIGVLNLRLYPTGCGRRELARPPVYGPHVSEFPHWLGPTLLVRVHRLAN